MGIIIAMMLTVAAAVVGAALLSDASASSVARVADAWKTMEVREGDIARTDLAVVRAQHASSYVDITLGNTGGQSINDFPSWDIVVKYTETDGTFHVQRLTYTTAASPGDDEWTDAGIFVAPPIQFDSAAVSTPSGARTSLSFSHTVGTESNRVLIVGTSGEETSTPADCDVTGVTFNGVALTEIGDVITAAPGPQVCVSLWRLLAPASGTYTVTVTYNDEVDEANAGAISLYNVKQQAPEALNSQTLDPASTITTTITTTTSRAWLVDVVGSGNPGSGFTGGTGQTERYDASNGTSAIAGGTKEVSLPGSANMSWTQVSGALAHVLAAFAPETTTEIFGPGVLDPGEEVVLRLKLDPAPDTSATLSFAISTPTGVVASGSMPHGTLKWHYLHNDPTPPTGDTNAQQPLPLDTTAPTATTLYNYDQDRDGNAALLIARGGLTESESDTTKYQAWRTETLTSALVIQGTVTIDLWSAIKDFSTANRGHIELFLRDYDGSSYTGIGGVEVNENPWDSAGTGTWIKKTMTITGLDYTIAAGNRLEVKLIVRNGSGDDMWFAYDTTTYASVVKLP